jgi:integrase
MFVTLLSQMVSRKMVLNVIGTFSSMITTARKWGYVAELIKLGDLALPAESVKTEARFFTPEQVRQIIRRAQEPFRIMFYILAMTGIRAGELLGLKVEDIDFERRLIFYPSFDESRSSANSQKQGQSKTAPTA